MIISYLSISMAISGLPEHWHCRILTVVTEHCPFSWGGQALVIHSVHSEGCVNYFIRKINTNELSPF